jgi:hypothetical protein
MPDHMGRADYHGTCIIQTARFMDAGVEEEMCEVDCQVHGYKV